MIKASAGNISATTLEKRVSILFEKIVALRRETPRSPSLREWEQCLRGIKKCAKKLAELVSDMDPPRVLKAHRDLFDLIQIALQSGPMAGSKPGKNLADKNVALVASDFLGSIMQSVEDAPLYFSDAQKKRLSKWHARANSKHDDTSPVSAPETLLHQGFSKAASAPSPKNIKSSVKTKVNKKKLSAKEKGKLRRERKQAATSGSGVKGKKGKKKKRRKESR